MDKIYIYNGVEYTEDQVIKAAENLGLNFADYIKKYGVKIKGEDPGKPMTTALGAPVEGNQAPESLGLELTPTPSISPKIEIPETPKTGIIDTGDGDTLALTEEEQEQSKNIVSTLTGKTLRGISSFGAQVASIPENAIFASVLAYHEMFEGGMTREEQIALKDAIKLNANIATPFSSDNLKAAGKALDPLIKQYDDKDIYSAIENGNYLDAAEMTVGGALESAPSIAAAMLGPGAIAVFAGGLASEKFDQELRANPEKGLGMIGMNALLTGGVEAAGEMFTRKLLFGFKILKQTGATQAAKEYLENSLKTVFKKYGIKPLGEGFSEALTESTTMLFDKLMLDKELSWPEIRNQLVEAFTIGTFMGGTVNSIQDAYSQPMDRNLAEQILMPTQTQFELRNSMTRMSTLSYELQKAKKEGNEFEIQAYEDMLAEEEQSVVDKVNKNKAEIATLEGDNLTEYASNRDQLYKLDDQNRSKKTSFEVKKRNAKKIQELNKRNQEVIENSVESAYNQQITTTQEYARDANLNAPVEFKTQEAFDNYIDQRKNERVVRLGVEGVFFPSTGDIIINKTAAMESRNVNAPAHEMLHALLNKAMADGEYNAEAFAEVIFDTLETMLSDSNIGDTEFGQRLQHYASLKSYGKKKLDMEVLTLFNDALVTRDMNLPDSKLTELGDMLRRTWYSFGFKRKFNKPQDVLNFLKDYNNSIKKGYVDKSIVRIQKEGAEGRLLSKDDTVNQEVGEQMSMSKKSLVAENKKILSDAGGVKNLTEEQRAQIAENVNKIKNLEEAEAPQQVEGVSKESVERSQNTQKAYEQLQGYERLERIAELNKPFITKTVNELFKEDPGFKERAFDKEAFRFQLIHGLPPRKSNSLYALIESYKPETGKALSQYIMANLKNRGKGILQQRIGEQVTEGAASLDDVFNLAEEVELPELPVRARAMAVQLGVKKSVVDNVTSRVKERLAGAEYTIERVNSLAKQAKMSFNEYVKKYNLERDDFIDEDGKKQTVYNYEPDLPIYYRRDFISQLQKNFREDFTASIKQTMPKNTPGKKYPNFNGPYDNYIKQNLRGIYETFTLAKVKASTAGDLRSIILNKDGTLKPFDKIKDVLLEYYISPKSETSTDIRKREDFSPQLKTQHKTQLSDQIADALGFQAAADLLDVDTDVKSAFEFTQKAKMMDSGLKESGFNAKDIVSNAVEFVNDKVRSIDIEELESRQRNRIRKFSRASSKLANKGDMNILDIHDFLIKEFKLDFITAQNIIETQYNLFNYIKTSEVVDRNELKELYDIAEKAVDLKVVYKKTDSDKEVNIEEDNFNKFNEFFNDQKGINEDEELYSLGRRRMISMMKKQNALPNDYKKMTNAELQDYLNNTALKVKRSQMKDAKKVRSEYDTRFNQIMEESFGIDQDKIFSAASAQKYEVFKRRMRSLSFIPPSAEDFEGLLYKTLTSGKKGEAQYEFYKETLLDPFTKATYISDIFKNGLLRQHKELLKTLPVYKNSSKVNRMRNVKKYFQEILPGTVVTRENAVRLYLWRTNGTLTIPGDTVNGKPIDNPNINDITVEELDQIMAAMNKEENIDLLAYAGQMGSSTKRMSDGKQQLFVKYNENWLGGTIGTDMLEYANGEKRTEFLSEWQENVDSIFTKDNLNKLKATFGVKYVKQLQGSLRRMKSGRNRSVNQDVVGQRFLDFVNGSVANIMFLNMRSAALQTISFVNFVNWSDNNMYAASRAFANQPQYWKDFMFLMNGDYLTARRGGLKMDISADELAQTANDKNAFWRLFSKIGKAGFIPTQMMDSAAISLGGATFYRNRVNSLIKKEYNNRVNEYLKQGIPAKEIKKKVDSELNEIEKLAKEKAMLDFISTAEKSQQSSNPSKISGVQADTIAGRLIFSFANTQMQYARIMKKSALDLVYRRGDPKTNISKLVYYGAIQNLIFNSLQNLADVVGSWWEDEEEDPKKKDNIERAQNGMLDSHLRGIGYFGIIAYTLLQVQRERKKQEESGRFDAEKVGVAAMSFSPPLQKKFKEIAQAERLRGWRQHIQKSERLGNEFTMEQINNPKWMSYALNIQTGTNLPTARVLGKLQNLYLMTDEDVANMDKVMLGMGWDKWTLDIDTSEPETGGYESVYKKSGGYEKTYNQK